MPVPQELWEIFKANSTKVLSQDVAGRGERARVLDEEFAVECEEPELDEG